MVLMAQRKLYIRGGRKDQQQNGNRDGKGMKKNEIINDLNVERIFDKNKINNLKLLSHYLKSMISFP